MDTGDQATKSKGLDAETAMIAISDNRATAPLKRRYPLGPLSKSRDRCRRVTWLDSAYQRSDMCRVCLVSPFGYNVREFVFCVVIVNHGLRVLSGFKNRVLPEIIHSYLSAQSILIYFIRRYSNLYIVRKLNFVNSIWIKLVSKCNVIMLIHS